MIEIFKSDSVRAFDSYTINSLKVDELQLMDNAGEAIFKHIDNNLKDYSKNTLIVCGMGNNGGDGYCLAQKMHENGYNVTVLRIKNRFTSSSLYYFNEIKDKVKIVDVIGMDFSEYTLIVDCIFGTGLSKKVDGEYSKAIKKINEANSFVLAVDIPSGLNASGLIMGTCVKANQTISLGFLKTALYLNDASDVCGEIFVYDIGIVKSFSDNIFILEDEDIKELFPKRLNNTHKGDNKKIAIVGGSKTMMGASLIAENATSALSVGAGYSTLCIPESLFQYYALKEVQSVLKLLSDISGELTYNKNELDELINTQDVIVIGMGLGVGDAKFEVIKYLLNSFKKTLLIDADGLNNLSMNDLSILLNKSCKVVLTPHIKEFSRLIQKDVSEIKENAIDLAKEFASTYGVIVVLKSAVTIITDGEKVFINTKGSPCMAKAGTGDVLSGVIGGMLLKTDDILLASASGCYLNGLSGEICAREINEYSVLTTDLVNGLKKAVSQIIKEN